MTSFFCRRTVFRVPRVNPSFLPSFLCRSIMMTAIFVQAPGPNINFGTAPSGSTYISDANGLVVITGATAGAVNDELYLLGAGCIALVPGGFGQNSLQTGTSYTVQLSDAAQEIVCTNAGAFALNLAKTMPVGFCISATQGGAGTVT